MTDQGALGTRPPPVLRLEGGPGGTNMKFARASRLADNHDVVLVGYRGIDSSVRLDCPEVSSALKRSTDFLGQKSFRAYTQAFRDCAARLQEDGVDLAGYTLPQQVDDLEAARRALGYGRIDLVSESAGTRLAMIYAWRYPRQHPPLGDDRRQPARSLPLGPEGDRRADRPLRAPLRAGRELQQADGRPGRVDAQDGARTCPTASGACRSRRATRGSRPSTG